MKICDNCLESNSDGATHCVICAEPIGLASRDTIVEKAPSETPPCAEANDATDDDAPDTDRIPHWHDEAGEPADDEEDASFEAGEDEHELDEVAEAAMSAEDADGGDDTAAEAAPADEPSTAAESGPAPASTGTVRRVALQVLHDSKPDVVCTHPVVNDITLVGREDPQRDVYPDLDLGRLAKKGVSADRVSRQHLRLLRQAGRYYLFVYRGSTGTQVNKKLVDESQYGKKFEISVGDRFVLGGKVRLKLVAAE